MNSNIIGTILRIFAISFSILVFWYLSINIFYFLITLIFDIDFSLGLSFLLFGIVILIRMFYPKNVFV